MGRPFFVAVAGGTGSGKTTVAKRLVDRVGSERLAVIHHDSYYYDLPEAEPESIGTYNFDHPDSLETSLLVEHLGLLAAGKPAPIPVYDFAHHRRSSEMRWSEPRQAVLIEGLLVLAEESLRDLCDLKIYVDTDADIRFIRRLKRDRSERGRSVDSVVDQYLRTVRHAHLDFVEPSKRWADVIVPGGAFNTVALDLVATRIEAELARKESPAS